MKRSAPAAILLATGILAGCSTSNPLEKKLDYKSAEPPKADNPLLSTPNCIVTPHIAWATKEARSRLMNIAVDNLVAFINGKAQNVVNA